MDIDDRVMLGQKFVYHTLKIKKKSNIQIINPILLHTKSKSANVCMSVISQFSITPISIRSLSHAVVLVGLRAVGGYSSHCAVRALCCAVGFQKQYFQNRRIGGIHGFQH